MRDCNLLSDVSALGNLPTLHTLYLRGCGLLTDVSALCSDEAATAGNVADLTLEWDEPYGHNYIGNNYIGYDRP